MRLVGDENLKLVDLSPTKRIFYHLGARAQLRPKLLKQGERIRLHEGVREDAHEISLGYA